ncbi:MFS transporter [Primorskyibacter aestuariivivens]|uniref:MFS transporter n=1 Tax=Primorskyibacter aestuariivivens TaxID=1888912 RepID=UPI002301FC27|nr:MFS transporter [Primorskyibacter aestuariivivens]MDA7427672.1 MFS transporter [Primorskyibacter aestuariivivens]
MREASFLRLNAPWLGAGALLTFLSGFGQTYFISIFAGEIRAEFGLSNGQWGGIYTLGTTASALLMVWAGSLADRFRVRALGASVLVLLACACLLMSLSTAWLLPVVIFALRFTGQGMTSHIAVVAMSRWFVATRGRALSIATLGFSVGEALLPLIFVSLLVLFDWRVLWVAATCISLLGVPLLMMLLRQERQPASDAENNQSFGMDARHWTRAETLRHPLFWFMVPAILGPAAFNTAFFFLQVHFAEIKGSAHVELVAMFPFYTAISVVSMMLSGWLLDRFGTKTLIPFYQLPMVVAFLCFAVADSPFMALVGMTFLGVTTGANATLPNAFWAEFYGTAHIGAIKSLAAAVMVFGSAIGPGLTGVLIDLGFGIEQQYVWVASYFVLTSLLVWVGVSRFKTQLTATA